MTGPTKRAPLIDFTETDRICLMVGGTRLRWAIDVHHLAKSPYFRKETQPENRHQLTAIELPLLDVDIMRLYLHFLVTDQIPDYETEEDADEDASFDMLASLYCHGHVMWDERFRDCILEEIYRLMTSGKIQPTTYGVRRMYEATVEGCKARSLLVDLFYHHGRPWWLNSETRGRYPFEFLQDLAKKRLIDKDAVDYGQEELEMQDVGVYCESSDKMKSPLLRGRKKKRKASEQDAASDL